MKKNDNHLEINDNFDMNLLNVLKKRREHLKLTRQDVATRLGIRTGLLVAWEGGAIPSSHYYLMKWMQVLGFDISNFLGNQKCICSLPVLDKIQWIKGKFYFKYQLSEVSKEVMFIDYPVCIDRDSISMEDWMNIDVLIDNQEKKNVFLGYRINPTENFDDQANEFLNRFLYKLRPDFKEDPYIHPLMAIGINMKTHRLEIASLLLFDHKYFKDNNYAVHLNKGSLSEHEEEQKIHDQEMEDFDAYLDNLAETEYRPLTDINSIEYGANRIEEQIHPYFFRILYMLINPYIIHGMNAFKEEYNCSAQDFHNTMNDALGVALDYVPFKAPLKQNPDEIPSEHLTNHVLAFPNQRK